MPDDREQNIARAQSQGTSLASMLLVLFVGLKLTGYIAWTWWWVLSPAWIPFAAVLAALVVVGFVVAVLAVLK